MFRIRVMLLRSRLVPSGDSAPVDGPIGNRQTALLGSDDLYRKGQQARGNSRLLAVHSPSAQS